LRTQRPTGHPDRLDGSITIIADKYNGKKLNSPNDLVVAADDSIWFCDPAYGIGGYYEGIKADPEQEKKNVYRVDPKSGDIKVVVDDFVEPNGLCLSPDEKKLYICDTGFTDGPDNRRISACSTWMWRPERCRTAKSLRTCPSQALPTGCAVTPPGVLVLRGWGDPNEDGVRCYTADGDLLGRSTYPKPSPTCASAVSNEIDFTSAARHRSTQSTRVCRVL